MLLHQYSVNGTALEENQYSYVLNVNTTDKATLTASFVQPFLQIFQEARHFFNPRQIT